MKLTIVIPMRMSDDVDITLWSLFEQTYRDFKIVIVPDQGKGANWARNEGFKSVDTEYVMFSDNDIKWLSRGVEWLVEALDEHSEASYSYGSWSDQRGELCFEEFDAEELKKRNYISTMSLIRTKDFPGFDENIKRLQDWDIFLTMLEREKVGVQCGKRIFTTVTGGGITGTDKDDEFRYKKAREVILKKHNL